MTGPKKEIAQFMAELLEIPVSDPLVHIDAAGKNACAVEFPASSRFSIPSGAKLEKLIKRAQQEQRESDLNPLCLARGIVRRSYKGRIVESPLLLYPLIAEKKRRDGEALLSFDEENVIINPFLANRFSEPGVALPDEIPGFAELAGIFSNESADVLDLSFIGSFHHHRFAILREMELLQQSLSLSPLVRTILGEESAGTGAELGLSEGFLTSADTDQRRIFPQLMRSDLVVQGPPGTGKSQVLTNLLGKRLPYEGMTLVVSEKKAALDVLVKKLAIAGLDRFAFVAHNQAKPSEILGKLKSNWHFLETGENVPVGFIRTSDQLHDNLQLILNKLSLPELIGGTSFSKFVNLYDFQQSLYRSDIPSIPEWLKIEAQIAELLADDDAAAFLAQYKQSLFLHTSPDKEIRKIGLELGWLRDAGLSEIAPMADLPAIAARCVLVSNESFKAYFSLFAKPGSLKKFRSLQSRYTAVLDELHILHNELSLWKSPPSESLLNSLIGKVESVSGLFRKQKLRKLAAAYLTDPNVELSLAIRNGLRLLGLQEERIRLDQEFFACGINDPAKELEAAAYIIGQLEKDDPNELNAVIRLPENIQKILAENVSRINEIFKIVRLYVYDANGIIPVELPPSLVKHIPFLAQISPAAYRLIAEFGNTEEIRKIILFSHWQTAVAKFPFLEKMSGADLKSRIEAILSAESEEYAQHALQIIATRKKRFAEYALLLRTPATRLSPEKKLLKQQLRTGKSLLVKEFAKTRSHKTIRELLQSDARPWIALLTPVWLSTPAQISRHFPMEENLFSLAVFDEASQVPLPNALGALQRSGRVLIAGDGQQMSPTSFFGGALSSVDLLHQAGFYWPSVMLTHHYRSAHPALIAFSNRHFYDNRLLAFPSPNAVFPLHRHFVPEGLYENRTNLPEAKRVAEFLETVNWSKTVGITAFSLQQTEEIWKASSDCVRNNINEGLADGSVFFKALENIQGDECDILVISMAYGKDAAGNFAMRFGPLNRANGYKRLNVLLTRAREELHFFTSVSSADLDVSANEAVNLLRLFLRQLEDPEGKGDHSFAIDGERKAGNTIMIRPVGSGLSNSRELCVVYDVLRSRGWDVELEA
jgi:hypothetical protein